MDKSDKEYWEGTRKWGKNEVESFNMIMNDASSAFPREVWEMLAESFSCFKGKKILVPSCGDGLCALGFCRLESIVLATDFCDSTVEQVRNKARENGLLIETKTLDSKDLEDEPPDKYDLVFTSCGVLSCMTEKADLEMMFKSFYRVLKPNGRYILFDYHPSTRMFRNFVIDKSNENHLDRQKTFIVEKPYWEVRWRIEDCLRILMKLGFTLVDFREMCTELDDSPIYKNKTYISAYLPYWLGISVVKS